jgi:hypothetical protein
MVIGFSGGGSSGEIVTELDRLRDNELVRLVDVLLVAKDEHGNVAAMDGDRPGRGAAVESLLGLGIAGDEALRECALVGTELRGDGDVWFATQAIPPGTSAAITLIEHLWVIPLRDAIARAGGVTFADAWVHPEDLSLIGDLAARPLG